jgi:hypothetical protein
MRENGNLAAPYLQLEAWGVTTADIPKALAELYATGFVELTKHGMRQAGGGEPSRYALTWLPTFAGKADGRPPTNAWEKVIKRLGAEGVGTVAQARAWLKAEVAGARRGQSRKRPSTPQLQVASPLSCQVRAVK